MIMQHPVRNDRMTHPQSIKMNWYKDENRTTGTTDRQSHGGCGGHDIVSILGVIILEE